MGDMRSLTSEYRLQALSVPEIADEFEDATKAISRACTFNGRKLKPGPLLNALVLQFLEMSEGEREAVAGEWLSRLEMVLSETEDEKTRARAKIGRHAVVGHAVEKPSSSRKKGSG